jgi:hypothetical protein
MVPVPDLEMEERLPVMATFNIDVTDNAKAKKKKENHQMTITITKPV